MGSALPPHIVKTDQAQISLVHQRCSLQGLIRALVPHVAVGDAAQFGIDRRRQALKSILVAVTPCPQETRDFDRLRGRMEDLKLELYSCAKKNCFGWSSSVPISLEE